MNFLHRCSKKIKTGFYLNYQTYCNLKRKVNLIKTLHTTLQICFLELLPRKINQKLLHLKNQTPENYKTKQYVYI